MIAVPLPAAYLMAGTLRGHRTAGLVLHVDRRSGGLHHRGHPGERICIKERQEIYEQYLSSHQYPKI
jgi:hypothetical protein